MIINATAVKIVGVCLNRSSSRHSPSIRQWPRANLKDGDRRVINHWLSAEKWLRARGGRHGWVLGFFGCLPRSSLPSMTECGQVRPCHLAWLGNIAKCCRVTRQCCRVMPSDLTILPSDAECRRVLPSDLAILPSHLEKTRQWLVSGTLLDTDNQYYCQRWLQ